MKTYLIKTEIDECRKCYYFTKDKPPCPPNCDGYTYKQISILDAIQIKLNKLNKLHDCEFYIEFYRDGSCSLNRTKTLNKKLDLTADFSNITNLIEEIDNLIKCDDNDIWWFK